MKFRDLKKKKFWGYLDTFIIKDGEWEDAWGESYITHDENGLILYSYWELDNGLYCDSGYTKGNYSWKYLKKTLRLHNKGNWLQFWDGKCKRCGCTLTKENYHVDKYFPVLDFENDNYYCNDCRQKEIDDYVKWMEKYDEEHKDELYI